MHTRIHMAVMSAAHLAAEEIEKATEKVHGYSLGEEERTRIWQSLDKVVREFPMLRGKS